MKCTWLTVVFRDSSSSWPIRVSHNTWDLALNRSYTIDSCSDDDCGSSSASANSCGDDVCTSGLSKSCRLSSSPPPSSSQLRLSRFLNSANSVTHLLDEEILFWYVLNELRQSLSKSLRILEICLHQILTIKITWFIL